MFSKKESSNCFQISNLKGNSEVSWCGVNGIIESIQEMVPKEQEKEWPSC